MSSSDSETDLDSILDDNFLQYNQIFDDDFLQYHQISEELEPDIGYLLQPTPYHNFDDSFDVPSIQSPPTPENLLIAKSLDFDYTETPQHSNLPIFSSLAQPNTSAFAPNKPLLLNMEKLATCRKYGGYPHENASQFLAEFESYAVLHNILPEEHARKIAAFHLHLCGPAVTWFNKISIDHKKSWYEFEQIFRKQYIDVDYRSPTVLLESEIFEALKLSKGQSIDDYYAQLLEKATILRKHDHEILIKFIKGLPQQLAFFVRAGNHGDSASALAAAKMGEAYGYRTDDAPLVAAA